MKRLLISIAVALAFVGCTREDYEEPQNVTSPDVEFYASLEGSDEGTKTYLDEDVKLLWTADDRISLFRSTLNEQFRFKGETGDNAGTFALVPSDEWGTGNETSTNYGVYPYDESTRLTNREEIKLTMPAVQQYAPNSFGLGANTMVAATESPSSTFLPFRNVGGFLLLKLYSPNATIASIELKGNNSEVLAGTATVLAQYGLYPLLTMNDGGATVVKLDCGEGVKLSTSADEPTQFWIVVPPTTFENGFTITITDTEGNETVKSTSKPQTIERNGVKSMAAFEIEEIIPETCKIYYTSTEKITPGATDVFGANIVSNWWDSTTGEGVITFDGDVTMIGDRAFEGCTSLKNIIIPESVKNVGFMAFSDCTSLVDFTFPEGVTNIQNAVFSGCSSLESVVWPVSFEINISDMFRYCTALTSITIPEGVTSIYYTFYGCTSLESVTIPNSVTTIENGAFKNCTSLKKINIPNSVTSIDKDAFYGCSSLPVSDNIRYADTYLVEAVDKTQSSYTIKNGTRIIGREAFAECVSLTSINIPNGVITIGNSAFYNCI